MKLGSVVCRAFFAGTAVSQGFARCGFSRRKTTKKIYRLSQHGLRDCFSAPGSTVGIQKEIPPRRGACDCLICDRDRVRHRTAVTLSFARV